MTNRIFLVLGLALSLSSSRAQSDRFFVTMSGGDLYKVHIQTCATTFVGSTGYNFVDIAMTPAGELYGIVAGQIFRIDTTDANATYIGQSAAIGVAMVALNNTTLLVEYAQDLYTVSTVDATTSFVGEIGYGALGDLTWFSGQLYMSSAGQLIKIDSEDNFASILSVTPVGSFDPDMPVCEGLATAQITDGRSSIVGFSYPDLFCFSPVDGSYVPICQPPLPGDVPGAASLPPVEKLAFGCSGISTGENHIQQGRGIHIQLSDDQLEIIMPDGIRVRGSRLRDAMGKLINRSSMLTSTGAVIDLNGLASGFYVVEIASGSDHFVERFVHF